ncbi:MAG: hypothetical protein JWO32_2580 [Bacteroidetes bacterium]|nr:hypothetical protein [Bacteroidota bacterium]
MYFCNLKRLGALAQMVEQRTENPCVPGSIPGGTTVKRQKPLTFSCLGFFCKSIIGISFSECHNQQLYVAEAIYPF